MHFLQKCPSLKLRSSTSFLKGKKIARSSFLFDFILFFKPYKVISRDCPIAPAASFACYCAGRAASQGETSCPAVPHGGGGFGGVRGDGVRCPVKPSPSSFCTGSCDTEFLHFSTLIGVMPFPRFIEWEQKLLLFTLQYPSPGTRVFLWNIIKKVYF